MKLRHLLIQNFRGIKSLDWLLGNDFVCLVGPGDSGKSTVLDAIDFALSRRWNLSFDDCDFFDCDVTSDILIEATIGDLPERALSDSLFGLRLRGIGGHPRVIHDEPEDGDEEVVTIRLSVTSSLEPHWSVVTDRHPEGMSISASERERFGVARLGDYLDRDLSWKRGSTLSRITGEQDEHAHFLAEADRQARATIDSTQLPRMSKAAKHVEKLAARFGVNPRAGFVPAVDPGGSFGSVGLSLHDGNVPARQAGLGTRRLVSLAMQRSISDDGGIVLVDEVESGLEPFRLRRLLSELHTPSTSKDSDEPAIEPSTVVMTTHSPVALGQLRAAHVSVMRAEQGAATVIQAADDLQGVLITHAEAFLSRKVLVCEGATEMGIVTGLDQCWTESGEPPLAASGVALANGGGATKVAEVAVAFRGLGYPTALLADSDRALSRSTDELSQAGINAQIWAGEVCTEQRIFSDLTWAAIARAVQLAIDAEHPVREQVAAAMDVSPSTLAAQVSDWPQDHDETALRQALARSATSKSSPWFKNHRQGARLGRIIAEHLPEITGTDLAVKIGALREWVTGE